jgi:hypothetical protein
MGIRNPGGPIDKLQNGATLPTIAHESWDEVGQCERAEFPGREFRNDSDDGRGADNGTDEVFWKKSTTRKPAPAAAWDWDRMSSQTLGCELSYNKEPPHGIRGERGKCLKALEDPAAGCNGRPIGGPCDCLANASPQNMSVALEKLSNTTSVAGRRQEKAVRRLRSVIGHFTGANTLSDSDQQRKMEQAWDVSNEDR